MNREIVYRTDEAEVTLLLAVAEAAQSLQDSKRVGSIPLVARDERRLDLALYALDAWRGGGPVG